MNLRLTFSGKVEHFKMCSPSESESEQGDQSEGVDAKPSDLPLVRLKVR